MPRDLFAEQRLSNKTPRDLFAERGISAAPITPEQKSNNIPKEDYLMTPDKFAQGAKNMREGLLGGAQGAANGAIKMANLFTNNYFPQLDLAPQSKASQIGQTLGDVASYFIPGEAAGVGLKGLSAIPKLGEGVNALRQSIAASPSLSKLFRVGGAGTSGALYGAAHSPNDKLMGSAEGGGLGAGVQTAADLLTSRNPLVKLAARAALGYGAGQALGHPFYGSLAGMAFPQITEALGMGGYPSDELLEGLKSTDVAQAKAANDRLGTIVTPAQASGNYVTAATEGNLKRSPQAAQVAQTLEKLQTRGQSKAINSMLDSIYKPTSENEANINALYKQAHSVSLNNNALKQIKSNPLWSDALIQAKKDPSLIANLQRKGVAFKPKYENVAQAKSAIDKRIDNALNSGDVDKAENISDNYSSNVNKMMKQKVLNENNYHFLDEAKSKLDDMYQKAINQGNLRQASRINIERQAYLNKLDELNPSYEQARAAAHPKMVRQEIENKFNRNEEDFTGKNFYSKFLNSKKSTEDLLRNTQNFPEAQQAIKNMRVGWKHLSNMKTVSQGEAQAKTGISDARDHLKVIWNAIKKVAGAKRDIKSLKYAYSPDWDREFERIYQVKNKAERNRNLATLVGKMGTAAGLNLNEEVKE